MGVIIISVCEPLAFAMWRVVVVAFVVLCLLDQCCSIKYGTLRERKFYKIISVDAKMQNMSIFKMRSGRDESSRVGK